jgi:chromosome segregation ATPase
MKSADTASRSALVLEIADLEGLEREISDQRRQLHAQIDALPTDLALQQERELSSRRRELHHRIDELRVELGRKPGPAR